MNKPFPIKTVSHSFVCGSFEIMLETGLVAQNTDASVTIQVGDTVLLATVAVGKQLENTPDFFPLSVHYQERAYAGGKIPGSFFRREGRPSEGEILVSRLIDRCLRPLCPKSYSHEVQLVVTALSADPQIHPDIPGILAASAALALSSVPFSGPVGACRLGRCGEQWVLNPTMDERALSSMDLVVASNPQGLVMLESGLHESSEEQVVEAIQQAQALNALTLQQLQKFLNQSEAEGFKKKKVTPTESSSAPSEKLEAFLQKHLREDAHWAQSLVHLEQAEAYLNAHWEQWRQALEGGAEVNAAQARIALKSLARKAMRARIFEHQTRADGRNPQTIRALDIRLGVLPRVHGSSLFTRGGTQALAVATLGSDKDSRTLEDLVGSKSENFLMHYNFLPFCVGSTGPLGAPKRREIGHGALAKRAFQSLMSQAQNFPYCLRVVSEILQADGSSSMATVCAASLAMMDAGVPLPRHVAGVAMGLLLEGEAGVILSDISECEDHLGDMDFKVAGTELGITSLQMDVKLPGIPLHWIAKALQQAKAARQHLLQAMGQVISIPSPLKGSLQIHQMRIPAHKIRDLIGKGGSVIKRISESFQAKIDVSDSGSIRFSLSETQRPEALKAHILELVSDPELGVGVQGVVTRKEIFGLFVRLADSQKVGLLHISELQKGGPAQAMPKIGEPIWVQIMAIDSKTGKIKLGLHEPFSESSSLSTAASEDFAAGEAEAAGLQREETPPA